MSVPSGFGERDVYAYYQLRRQIQILYTPPDHRGGKISEFALDPCKTSKPYQLVVARVQRKATLAETLADLEKKIAAHPKGEYSTRFGPNDTLAVPNMAWRIGHRFRELEGPDKRFLNPGLGRGFLGLAVQSIEFRLNRGGAELASEAKVHYLPIPTNYIVNGTFLVLLKKRDGMRPFFAAWIENAELLQAFGTTQ